jgi:flagellar basal-body rod protein FlgB
MNFGLNILETARASAAHAGAAHALIARNVANADTPGYRALGLRGFAGVMEHGGTAMEMRATRAGHVVASPAGMAAGAVEIPTHGTESPNGNNVSLEQQMAASAEVRVSHDLALGIYRTTLDVLRTTLGRR